MLPIKKYFERFKLLPLFVVSHFSHHVITAIIVPLLPFIRSEFRLNYTQAGILLSAFTLSNGISQLPAGWLADRIGPKVLIFVGISGVAVGGLLVGLSQRYLMVALALVLVGMAAGGYHPAASPLISASVEPRYVGNALGLHVVGGSTSYFLAPLLGVGLAAIVGWRGAYIGLSAPVFIFGGVLYLILLRRNIGAGDRTGGTHKPSSAPMGEESGRKRASPVVLLTVLVLTMVSRIFGGSIVSFIPLYMVDHFGVDEGTAGAFLSIIYSAGFFAAPLGGHVADRIGSLRLLLILGLVHGPLLYLFLFVPYGWGFAALLLVFGIHMFMRMPTAESLILKDVPRHVRSTVLGIYFFVGMEGSGILSPLLGGMIDRLGFKAMFTLVSTVVLSVAFLSFLVVFFGRTRPARSGPGVG